jgi:uncharacterized protein YggE
MRPYLPVLTVALAATFAQPALADTAAPTPSISLSGKGEVVASPDTAFVTAGVTSEGKTARDALDANTKAMAALIETVKAAGVEAKDIQTSGFSVNPNYVYPQPDANGVAAPPHITGYAVQNGVSLKIRKLTDLGTILDQMVTAGGNTINGVSFSVDDPAKLLDEARKTAFLDAADKAKVYADAAGVGLGPVMSISEGSNQTAPQPMMFKAMAMARADSTPVPVEAGQLTYDVDVNVVWALKTGN